MAYESGAVNLKSEACLTLRFSDGAELEGIIDTAFDGALLLPRAFAESLKMSVTDQAEVTWLGETRVRQDLGTLRIQWLGTERDAEVIVHDGNEALIGTLLLEGTKLTIDYVARTVLIESAEPQS